MYLEGKRCFLRTLKNAPFSSLLRSSGEKPVIFKLRKKTWLRELPIDKVVLDIYGSMYMYFPI